jgi:capsular exopolysaccharide synthesis family protein
MAENVRYVRTSLMYSLAGRSPKTVLVTSAFPGEGKTTIAINLAIAFAQRGHKVLLMDADLKRPGIHKFFEVDRTQGLTEVLTGRLDGEAAQKTHVDNLSVLPSGSTAPNPVDLLDSDVMRDLLVALSEEYDHIVVDSAPMIGMADTTVLVPHVDGVVLVAQPGGTPRDALRKLKEKVVGVQGHVLGVVLNNARRRRKPKYAYRYGYGYGDGYGDSFWLRYGYGYLPDEGETAAEQEPGLVEEASAASESLPPPGEPHDQDKPRKA